MLLVRRFYPKRLTYIGYCGQSPQEQFGVKCLAQGHNDMLTAVGLELAIPWFEVQHTPHWATASLYLSAQSNLSFPQGGNYHHCFWSFNMKAQVLYLLQSQMTVGIYNVFPRPCEHCFGLIVIQVKPRLRLLSKSVAYAFCFLCSCNAASNWDLLLHIHQALNFDPFANVICLINWWSE